MCDYAVTRWLLKYNLSSIDKKRRRRRSNISHVYNKILEEDFSHDEKLKAIKMLFAMFLPAVVVSCDVHHVFLYTLHTLLY